MNWKIVKLILVFVVSPLFANDDVSGIPPEAKITEADQQAVARLGPARGAIGLVTDVRTLSGLNSGVTGALSGLNGDNSGLNGVKLDLNQAMSDLKGEVRGNQILLNLSSDVLFDFDKANIKPEAIPVLERVVIIIREKAQGTLTITGHTDAKGSDEYNQTLSEKRASVIHTWLNEKVVADYNVLGLGETQPVAPNVNKDGSDNPDGRAKNRRVEIAIQAEK